MSFRRAATVFRVSLVVLVQPEVPGDAGAGCYGAKLVDDVARDEVDVVVTQLEACVANALPAKLVELGLLDPLPTLQGEKSTWLTTKHLIQKSHVVSGWVGGWQ